MSSSGICEKNRLALYTVISKNIPQEGLFVIISLSGDIERSEICGINEQNTNTVHPSTVPYYPITLCVLEVQYIRVLLNCDVNSVLCCDILSEMRVKIEASLVCMLEVYHGNHMRGIHHPKIPVSLS